MVLNATRPVRVIPGRSRFFTPAARAANLYRSVDEVEEPAAALAEAQLLVAIRIRREGGGNGHEATVAGPPDHRNDCPPAPSRQATVAALHPGVERPLH